MKNYKKYLCGCIMMALVMRPIGIRAESMDILDIIVEEEINSDTVLNEDVYDICNEGESEILETDIEYEETDESVEDDIEQTESEEDLLPDLDETQEISEAETLVIDEIEVLSEDTELNITMEGQGTQTNPYVIENAEQMNNVRNNMSAYYVLKNDIDLSSYENWEPIGTEEDPFVGVFDGQNHTIRGLRITEINTYYAGIFGICFCTDEQIGATIKNVNVSEALISIANINGNLSVGTIAAQARNGKIYNCTVDGAINIIDCYSIVAGGIVGYGGTTESCTNRVNLYLTSTQTDSRGYHGDIICGGICGSGGNLLNCCNYGKIEAISGNFAKCGGICGEDGGAWYCDNYSSVWAETRYYELNSSDGENCRVGGIIGDPGNYVDVSCCINYGNVGGYAYKGGTCIVGGIVSRKQLWNSFGIKHCYNLASAISSTVQQKVNGSWEDIEGNAGRICTWATVQEECYSLDSTLVNGKLPTDEIGPDKINGGSLSYEDIQIAISGNYAGDSNVISTFPEKGEENVDPMLYGEGYNITVCFDDVVTKGTGNIDVINLDTNEITSFDINSDSQVSVDESVLTISNVKLPYGAHMCVVFENGCVNVGGKKFFGLSDQKDWEFTTKRFCTGLNIILGKDTFSFVNTEKDIGVSKGSPYPVNIMNWDMFLINNNFSVDDIAAIYNASKQMGGVCFGMSSVFVQNYYNTLNLGDLNNLEKPAKSPSTQELIGLNQYVVSGSKYRKVREQFTNQYTPVKRIKYLYELANSINKTKKPILIDYCWVGNENEEEEDARMKAHAVIAYGLDTEGSPYVYGGREYAYKIKVIDPNYLYSKEDTGDNRCIYITEDLQECIIPKSGTTASSIGTDTLVYSDTLQNNNDMQFQFITDDYEYIVPRGSVTIESPTISFITDTIIINGEKVDSFSVSGEPWVKSVAYLPSDDSNEYAMTQIRVEKMDYDIQIPHGTFSYNEDGLYISVTANSFADFKIAKSGTITLDTDSPYEISITAKDISSSESVNNVIISGEEAQNLVIDTNKEIIDIESNNLNGTSIQTGDVLQKDVNKIEIKTDTKTVSISPDNTSVNLEYNDKTKIDTAIIRVSDQYYSGESLFPAVEVICNGLVLQENIDYLISYNNNIKLGTATIEVSGIGTYIGTKTVTFNIVEKDHRWNPWRIVKVSTCTSNGISKRTCSICGKSEEKAVPSTGHKWGNWSVKAKATVFASEQQERICSSCGVKETRTVGKKLVPTIKLNVSSIPLKVKQSTNKVIVSGLANGDSIKSWSSSNTSIVKVNKKTGKITAQKKTGKALVTVTLASGKTAKVTVTVQKQDVKTTKISKLPAKITLEKGRTSTLKPVITPVTSLEKIAYKTSNKKVATVSGKGVVVAKGPGTAKITVASGKKKVTVKVTVPKSTTKKVSSVKASVEIPKGKSYTLKPKLYPADSTDTITYTSSNKNIATVSSKGKITGKKKGSTTITVKSGKIKVTCKVTVK